MSLQGPLHPIFRPPPWPAPILPVPTSLQTCGPTGGMNASITLTGAASAVVQIWRLRTVQRPPRFPQYGNNNSANLVSLSDPNAFGNPIYTLAPQAVPSEVIQLGGGRPPRYETFCENLLSWSTIPETGVTVFSIPWIWAVLTPASPRGGTIVVAGFLDSTSIGLAGAPLDIELQPDGSPRWV